MSLKEQLAEVLAPYRGQKGATIPALQKVQEKLGYLPEEAISEIAKFLGLSKNEVYGVATFYAQFRFERQGEHAVKVCQGTACHVRGGKRILDTAIEESGIKPGQTSPDYRVSLETVACFGACALAPVMVVDNTVYGKMTTAKARQVLDNYLRSQENEGLVPISSTGQAPNEAEGKYHIERNKYILRNCGHINPERIEDYLAVGGYQVLKKALLEMSPQKVIDEIKRSGLRGRGGAGFPTGQKWEFCLRSPGDQKYMICNADEGDPGAFMDRSILEADPHSLLEGMLIAAYAIGASKGYIYCRAEYPLAIDRLEIALKQMGEHGLLGNNIFGSGFNFDLEIKKGAGAFVCGEETALMASIEGKRGMPRPRPPFPANSGLWGKPTNINNVKTLVSAARIIEKGAEWFSSIGTEGSRGTAVFALTGKIQNSGLIEVPMGIPLADIIFDIGGGIMGGKRFKAVQTGGPSGGCVPASLLQIPVDYESLAKAGSIMGSGGMVVLDEDNCMVDMARFFLTFTQSESCGKCVPCRVGTRQMLTILERITGGQGKAGDIEQLEQLCNLVKSTSLCGLGQTAPNPILTTLKYFREEYEEHINKGYCRAGVCKKIVKSPCQNACPVHMDCPRYIRAIARGKPGEAVAIIREAAPFPAALGYVCVAFCEAKCRRGQLEQAIAIRDLKRFAADHDTGEWKKAVKKTPLTGKKVAIVGSGPSGLTAAYYLARQGHEVTVFEALPVAGGMMRVGIPSYRLPVAVLEREIKEIENAGVTIKTNSRVESLDELFAQGYHAVFVSVGAHKGTNMGVEGENILGVVDGVDFLRKVSLGEKVNVGNRVMVVGGGNVAIDAARTAIRLGAKDVTIVYRRTRAEMPASDEEVEEALEEGVNMNFLMNPVKITGLNGKVMVEFIKMELGKIDESGRRRPVPVEGSNFTEDYDLMIKAVGQESVVPQKFGVDAGRGGRIPVDPDTMATARPGVYAGGDVVSGPASVVEAIADGKQAAKSIDQYLGGTGKIEEALAPPETEIIPVDKAKLEGEKYRLPMKMAPAKERIKSFAQVVVGYDEDKAIEEAERCLRCDLEAR